MFNKKINLESKDFIRTYYKNYDKKMLCLQDEENELMKIYDNEEKSKEFFK